MADPNVFLEVAASALAKSMPEMVVKIKLSGGTWYEEEKPFARNLSFIFTGPAEAWGYSVFHGKELLFEEIFKGAPFVLPGSGGSIDLDMGSLEIEGIKLADILDYIEHRKNYKRMRNILDPWDHSW